MRNFKKFCFSISPYEYIILKDPDSSQFFLRKIYSYPTKSDVLTAFKRKLSNDNGKKCCEFEAFRPFTTFVANQDRVAIKKATKYLNKNFGS